MDQPNVVPYRNKIHHLIVEFGTNRNVDTVLIDGRVVVEGGEVVTIDESAIIRDYKASVANLIGY